MVALSANSTAEHATSIGVTPPWTPTLANKITLGASDTSVVVLLSAAITTQPTTVMRVSGITVGGVALTQVSGCFVYGFGNTDGDGFTDVWRLSDPLGAGGLTAGTPLTIAVTVNGWGGSIPARMCVAAVSVSGALDSVTPYTGGHPASVSGASSLSTGSVSAAATDLLLAIAANGTAQPTVTTGSAITGVTGSVNTGSDNAEIADNAGSPTTSVVFGTNSADESQASYVLLKAAAAGLVARAHNLVFTNLDTAHNW